MRCTVCNDIDLTVAGTLAESCESYRTRAPYRHHPTFKALQLSADSGCELCLLFVRGILDKSETANTVAEAAALGATTSITLWVPSGEEIVNTIGTFSVTQRVHAYTHLVVKCDTDSSSPGRSDFSSDLSRKGIFVRYDIFTDEENEAAKSTHVSGRIISPSPTSEENLNRITTWIDTCATKHQRCPSGEPRTLPTRVIDVFQDPPKLIDSAGMHERYACLSHCWGGLTPCKTTTALLSAHMTSLNWSKLPQNFKDAIVLSRCLQIKYLWIDSLCIIQDSEEDWFREAQKMGSYYSCCLLTIAAAAAKDTASGFLHERKQMDTLGTIPYKDESMEAVGVVHLRRQVQGWKASIVDGILSTRAWTLQERLLAPRIIHFGEDQCFWECNTCGLAEGGLNPQEYPLASFKRQFIEPAHAAQIPLPPPMPMPPMELPDINERPSEYKPSAWQLAVMEADKRRNQSFIDTAIAECIYHHQPPSIQEAFYHPYDSDRNQTISDRREEVGTWPPNIMLEPIEGSPQWQWLELVKEYTRRQLTRKSDYFPALSGLTAKFSSLAKDEFLCGIWQGDLLRGLLWRSLLLPRPDEENTLEYPQMNTDLASPSWSWSSVDGPCYYDIDNLRLRDTNFDAEVVDCGMVEPTGENAITASSFSGSLVLRGLIVPVRARTETFARQIKYAQLGLNCYGYELEDSDGDYVGDGYFNFGPGPAHRDLQIVLLVLGTWCVGGKFRFWENHGLILSRDSEIAPEGGAVFKHEDHGVVYQFWRVGSFVVSGFRRASVMCENSGPNKFDRYSRQTVLIS